MNTLSKNRYCIVLLPLLVFGLSIYLCSCTPCAVPDEETPSTQPVEETPSAQPVEETPSIQVVSSPIPTREKISLEQMGFAQSGWHGITPGETSQEDALSFLQSSPHVKPGSIYTSTGKLDDGYEIEVVNWEHATFIPPDQPHGLQNWLYIVEDRVRFFEIRLDFGTYLTYDVTAGEAVDYFGEPEKVARAETRNARGGYYQAIHLLYPSQGLAFECSTGVGVPLYSDCPISRVLYFEPTDPADFQDQVSNFGIDADISFSDNSLTIWLLHIGRLRDWTGFPPDP